MTTLLDKFSAVEIKADNRISAADKEFCEVQQRSYHTACDALVDIATRVAQYVEEQRAIIDQPFEYLDNKFNSSEYDDVIKKNHGHFVHQLVNHFTGMYRVSISADDIIENLVPAKPEEPTGPYSWGWRRNLTDEELNQWKETQEKYKKACMEYRDKLRAFRLDYSDVVDQIITQLDGLSFTEKAIKELKDASHEAAWNHYRHEKKYDRKKGTLTFSYGCSHSDWHDTFELHEDMKKVVRALAYYEYQSLNGANQYYGFRDLLGYRMDYPEFDFSDANTEKIKSVKCFKNGRVDIKFKKESYAREFEEQYLGLEE